MQGIESPWVWVSGTGQGLGGANGLLGRNSSRLEWTMGEEPAGQRGGGEGVGVEMSDNEN